jgi:hypothetical protein
MRMARLLSEAPLDPRFVGMPFFRWWELCVAIVIRRLAAETFVSLSVNLGSAWCEGGGLRFERSEHGSRSIRARS